MLFALQVSAGEGGICIGQPVLGIIAFGHRSLSCTALHSTATKTITTQHAMALRSWLANFFGRDPADERKIAAIVGEPCMNRVSPRNELYGLTG